MKKTTLLMKNLTFNLKKLHKLKSSLDHSLRLDKINISDKYDETKSKLNIVSFENSDLKYMGEDENSRLKFVNDLISELEELKQENSKITLTASESQKRSKSLKYLSEKIKDEEFQIILEEVQKHSTEENILLLENKFKELDFYQKPIIKNFNSYIELVKKGGSSKNKEFENKIVFNEMLLKIPNHNQITNISHKELVEYSDKFFLENFPMYEKKLTIGHTDEEVPALITKENIGIKDKGKTNTHIHLFHSTKNIFTNEYDFYKQQYLFVKKNLHKIGISESDFIKNCGTDNKKQNYTQLKNQGILFQEIFYQDINKNLFHKKGIEAYIKDKKEIVDIDFNLHTNGSKDKYNNITLSEETNQKNKEFLLNYEQELKNQEKENIKTLLEIQEKPIKGKTKEIFENMKKELLDSKNKIGYISDKDISKILNTYFKESISVNTNIQDKRKVLEVKLLKLETDLKENKSDNEEIILNQKNKIEELKSEIEELKSSEEIILNKYDKLILDFNSEKKRRINKIYK